MSDVRCKLAILVGRTRSDSSETAKNQLTESYTIEMYVYTGSHIKSSTLKTSPDV